MLMDSKGVSGGAPGENGALFGAQEVMSGGGDDKFDKFVNSREDLKPNIEMPAELIDDANSAEVVGEMQPQEQPASAAPVQSDPVDENDRKDQEVKAQLEQIKVARDAESLPKSY